MRALDGRKEKPGKGYVEPVDDWRFKGRGWLKSHFDDDVWIFSDPIPGVPAASSKLNWQVPVGSNNQFLTDPLHSKWLEIARKATWWYYESDLTDCTRSSSCYAFGSELRRVICWLIGRNINDPKEIMRGDINDYITYLASLDVGEGSVEYKLSTLRMLWTLREYLPSSLAFDPFPARGEIRRIAKRAGKPNGHTRTIPPQVLFETLEYALQWLEQAELIVEARDAYMDGVELYQSASIQTRYRQGVLALTTQFPSDYWLSIFPDEAWANAPVDNLKWAVSCLYASAVILLIAFTAMRKHELALLSSNPLTSRGEINFILGRVRKTAATKAGVPTERAIHPIGIKAVETLQRLRERSGDMPDRPLLVRDRLLSRNTAGKPIETEELYRLLDTFSKSSPYGRSKEMPLRPHMFRRAHALLYAWRFEIGDFEFLRRHLYHNDINSTLAYTNELDVSEYLPEAEKDLAHTIVEEALTGRRWFGGGFAKHLARLRAMVRVFGLERLQIFVTQYVEKHDLKLVPHPHGYCAVSSLRMSYAKCSNKRGPDYANRTDTQCAFCPNFLLHHSFLRHWLEQRRKHQAVLESPYSTPTLLEAAREGVQACDRIIDQLRREGANEQT